ncbi:unnamed protein product [Auanema sp. JU1783]|nr:unnamed protein product [Auanema sp. JU1783]
MRWFLLFLLPLAITGEACPHPCSCKENGTYVDCSDLKLTHFPTDFPISTKILNLRLNHISKVLSSNLKNLPHLELLILANNHIRYVEENLLDEVPHLKRLILAHNHLARLPSLASKHSALLALDMRHNHLERIHPNVFSSFPLLIRVDFSHNRLQSFHSQTIQDLSQTQAIILSGNPWNCDCRVGLLARALPIQSEHHPRCFNPAALRGIIVSEVQKTECRIPTSLFTAKQQILECPIDVVSNHNVVWLHKHIELDSSELSTYEIQTPNQLILPLHQDVKDILCTYDAPIVPRRKKRQRGFGPEFTYATSDRSFRIGARVQLHCEVSGSPQPEVVWFKNNRPFHQNSRAEFTHNNTVVSILSFFESDEGTYKCVAANVYGRIEREMKIGLIDSVGPYITDGPQDQIADIGAQVTFRCISKGTPRPIHTWMFDGAPLANIKGRIYVSPDTTELTIKNIRRSDRGIYICGANNPVGTMAAPASLQVRGSIADQVDNVLTDSAIREIAAKAITNVDKAIEKTKDLRKKKIHKPEELRRNIQHILPKEVIDINRAREIYEESVRLVNEYVEEGLRLQINELSPNITYESFLSAPHMQTLMNASGCIGGSHQLDSCSDSCFHKKYRSYNGECNNLAHSMWGVSSMPFLRLLPPVYENGFNTPVGWEKNRLYYGFPKPNPREVSRKAIASPRITAHRQLSSMVMQWGQFIDHDITFAATALSRHNFKSGAFCNKTCDNVTPCFNIQLLPNDPKLKSKDQLPCMEFERNAAVCGSGETSTLFDKVTYREQMNVVTSFIDASMVYGSTEEHALELRDRYYNEGLLRYDKISDFNKEYMPFERDSAMDCRRNFSEQNPTRCFLSGDFRANEQQALAVMHTIFLREHNRIARKLKRINKHWDGDTIYQETRKIVGAMIQHITYNEWLPIVLGSKTMEKFRSLRYNPNIHAGISNAFATAAFRFGHTLINPILLRLDKNFREVREGHLPLHKSFFAPGVILYEGGIDPLLRGLFASPMKEPKNTEIMNMELTEKLFLKYHQASLDLAVMNIQRGRDHGLPSYTEFRELCNLTVPRTWDELIPIVNNAKLIQNLRQLYGHPGNIDLFVGGVSELLEKDALMGPTFHCIITEQFQRLRSADRFWFENEGVFTSEQVAEIKKITLSRILCNNGDEIERVHINSFVYPGPSESDYQLCSTLSDLNLQKWKSHPSEQQCSVNKNNILSRRRRSEQA